MKKFFIFSLLIVISACDDGDLQIENVDFSDASLQLCDASTDQIDNNFFFKIKGDEAFILSVNDNTFQNTTSLDSSITSTLNPTATPQLIYRLFTEDVTSSYFCSDIPPASPTVVNESTATGGQVIITSRVNAVSRTNKDYAHKINIKNLSLSNEKGERLTDTSTLNYGSFTTSTSNSANFLDADGNLNAFSNYSAIEFAICDKFDLDRIRLYKLNTDEFVSIDIPPSFFVNEVTTEDNPRIDSLQNSLAFKNIVLDTIASQSIVCPETLVQTNVLGHFVSTGGELKVTTVDNGTNAEGVNTFTHTILIENLVLTMKGDESEADSDIVLSAIPSLIIGTIDTKVE